MIRRLFAILAGMSLVTCAAIIVLWVHSYSHEETLISPWLSRHLGALCIITSDAGEIEIELDGSGDGLGPMQTTASWSHLGVSVMQMRQGSMIIESVNVHYWDLPIVLGIVPLTWVATIRKARWGDGRCRRCGYDLRASKDRCPECGAPILPTVTEAV